MCETLFASPRQEFWDGKKQNGKKNGQKCAEFFPIFYLTIKTATLETAGLLFEQKILKAIILTYVNSTIVFPTLPAMVAISSPV